MNKHIHFILLFSLTLGIFKNATSQTISQLSFFSPLISTFDADYNNDHLYVSQQLLIVFDVSDSTDPEKVGQVLYPGNYAYQIAAENNHVYMAMGNNGIFAMYNVSIPTQPWMTGSVSIPATSFLLAGDLAPFGARVFMAGFDSLYVIDISDSSAPVVAHRQQISDVGFAGAGVMGIVDSALFISNENGTKVFDISNPDEPVFLTTIENSHFSQKGLAVDTLGKRIFLPWTSTLATFAGYDALDITNPSTPVYLFSDSTNFGGGDYGETAYHNNVLFISEGGGINAFDVSFNHHYVTSFSGQDVANATVALDIRDSVFYNVRGGGFEILLYEGGFPTGINVINESSASMQLFPNPVQASQQEIVFTVSESMTQARVSIWNSFGKEIARIGSLEVINGKGKLKLPKQLSPGVYFISINGSDQKYSGKFALE